MPDQLTPRNHGGRRPGAGAPRGNWNALKHGRRSPRILDLFAAAVRSDDATAALTHLARLARLYRHGLTRR